MATDIASLQIKVDTSQVKTADKDLSNFSGTSKKTESATESLNATYLKSAAALGVISYTLKQTINAAAAYQNSLNGLASVARYAGEDVEKTLKLALQTTQDGLLSTTEAATALKNLLARGFSTQEAVTMIERFKDAAAFGRQASLDFGQAVVSATEGIKNENSVLVDNAGVTKNVSVMWKEYAAQINKSVNDLTMAEKRQAEYNGILAETEGQLGNAAIAADGVDGANARLNKTFTDMSVTIGQSLTPAYIGLTNAIATGFQGATDYGIKPFLFAFEALGISFGAHIAKMKAFFGAIASPSKFLTGELSNQIKLLEDLAEEMRIEAAGRLSGITPPSAVMGADSGKRRQDVVVNDPLDVKSIERKRQAYLNFKNEMLEMDKKYLRISNDIESKIIDESRENRRKSIEYAVEKQKEFNAEVEKIKDSVDPTREYTRQINSLAEMFNMGRLSADEFAKAAEMAQKNMLGFTDKSKDAFEELKDAINGYSKDMSRSLAEFALNGKTSFGDMVNSMMMQLLTMINQKYIFDPLFKGISGAIDSSIGSSGGGIGDLFSNLASNIFGGFRATGGSVTAGKSYVVGENGMELFTPNTSGSITPNNKLGGNQVVNIQIVEAQGTRANVQQQQNPDGSMSIKLIVEQLYGVMNRDLQRGGGIAPTLERRYGLNRMAGT